MWPPCRCQNYSSRRLETTKAKNAEEKKLENGVRAGTRGETHGHRLWGDSSAPPAHLQAPCLALGGTAAGGTAPTCPGTPSFPQRPPRFLEVPYLSRPFGPFGNTPRPPEPPREPAASPGSPWQRGMRDGAAVRRAPRPPGGAGTGPGVSGGGLGRAWGGAGGRSGVSTGGTYTCGGVQGVHGGDLCHGARRDALGDVGGAAWILGLGQKLPRGKGKFIKFGSKKINPQSL